METNDPIPTINRLLDRLDAETRKLGVKMRQPIIVPGRDGGPSMLQVFFEVEPEALDTRDPQAVADEKAVEEMMARSAEEQLGEQSKTVMDDVEKWLNE